jgi:3D-(3,5/4)-trihydroxycyclohexane-1,2-dione acylhydrolase (decyclizing)
MTVTTPGTERRQTAATTRLTAAQAIVRFLGQQYVARDGQEQRFFAGIFGIFGHGNVTGIGQALEELGDDLPYYQPRNEQAMVHTAAGYAKMRNRLQTFACTSSIGPGATNMVTGAAGATINRLPVLLLPGDVFASRRPHPVLQQLEDFQGRDISVNDAFRPVSRFFDRITRPEQLLDSLPEAVRVLTDPAQTGAVTIALPQDVQTEAFDVPASFLARRTHRVPRTTPADSEIEVAAQLIAAAERPLIVAGGGVVYAEATAALASFAESFGIPVCETQAGKGSLPWDHPWQAGPIGAAGGLAANRLAAEADLVIVVGTRLGDFPTASKTAFQHPEVRLIGLNVVAMDAVKLNGFPLVGDARAGLEALAARLTERGYHTRPEYATELRGLQADWNDAVDRILGESGRAGLTEANAIGIVNDASRPEDVVVCAAGSLPGDLNKLWRTRDVKGYHLEYGYSCMGYEIAGGLGAKMAAPEREVYVMVGDGSYLMMHTEIVTSLQEGMKLIVVLLDNSGFQCIRGLQESSGSPAFGNELRFRDRTTGRLTGDYVPVDFAKNAESLGALALTASDADQLRTALDRARAADRTTVIHVTIDPDARVPGFDSWWDVPIAEHSAQPSVQQARERYDRARQRQRLF